MANINHNFVPHGGRWITFKWLVNSILAGTQVVIMMEADENSAQESMKWKIFAECFIPFRQ